MLQFKYEALADEIASMIDGGVFPSGKLPSEPEIMSKFNVGKITVYKALDKLVRQEKIVRIKGKGTFAKAGLRGNSPDYILSKTIGVIMPCRGHYFGEFFDAIRDNLLTRGYFPMAFDVPLQRYDEFSFRNNIDSLLSSGLKGILIYGGSYWHCPFLEDYSKIESVFMDHYDYDGEPASGMAVMADYEDAVYQTTRHMLEKGYRNIAYLRYTWNISIDVTESHRKNNPRYPSESGYRKALREAGLENKEKIYIKSDDNAVFDLQLRGLLARGKDSIDGIICASDAMAFEIIKAAEAAEINVPGDLAVAGLFNTPWCLNSQVPLTSCDMNVAEIAKESVKMILKEIPAGTIKIKPRLMIRESSGGESSFERKNMQTMEWII